ncbi:alpha-1,2-fucosyltransferase, partial [Helicobacter typhlonius]|uniref:alpha-1,2-fucosyltransferase n=1 Tax=Helicobacter typhlonius TaxID=76936 RepID=UPI002FE154FE
GGGGIKQETEHIRNLELQQFAISLPIVRFNPPKPHSKDFYNLIATKMMTRLCPFYSPANRLIYPFFTYESQSLLDTFLSRKTFRPHSYFIGHFTNLKYFEEVDSILRKEFVPRTISLHTQSLAQQITATPKTAFLHIRRGDYLIDKHWRFIKLGSAYYNAALKALIKKSKNPVVFVFSDDILWCKEHFTQYLDSMLYRQVEFVFMEGNGEGNAIEDLTLMRSCQNGIMANSTFSYWAAYLIDNPSKLIYAPAYNFYEPHRNVTTHLPHSYQRYEHIWGMRIDSEST